MSKSKWIVFLAAIFVLTGARRSESRNSSPHGGEEPKAEGLLQPISATTNTTVSVKLRDLPVGKVIQIGEIQFAKIGADQYQATTAVCDPNSTRQGATCICKDGYKTASNTRIYNAGTGQTCTAFSGSITISSSVVGTMQALRSSTCDNIPTPLNDNYVQLGKYTDSRDSTNYVIRKYSDGRCWMAENLKLGKNCTYTAFNTSDTASLTGYVGTYNNYAYKGACRSAGDNYDGNLYNWEAAMNNSTAVYNGTYNNRVNGTTLATHDICPMGWHVPTGGPTVNDIKSEWQTLSDSVQGSEVSNGCSKDVCATVWNFYHNSSSWNASGKSNIAGSANNGGYSAQSTVFHIWSSNEYPTASGAYSIYLYTYTAPLSYHLKYRGDSVRCILDN